MLCLRSYQDWFVWYVDVNANRRSKVFIVGNKFHNIYHGSIGLWWQLVSVPGAENLAQPKNMKKSHGWTFLRPCSVTARVWPWVVSRIHKPVSILSRSSATLMIAISRPIKTLVRWQCDRESVKRRQSRNWGKSKKFSNVYSLCLHTGLSHILTSLKRGLWHLKQVSQAGINNHIPHPMVCNYLSLPEIPSSGTKVFIYHEVFVGI